MSKRISIELKNDLSEIKRMSQIVVEFCAINDLPPDILFALNLSIEEVLTNVISYGYEDNEEHQILVRMNIKEDEVLVEVEDDGKPFNPLEVDEPALDKSLEDRPIGGLGIHLVRNYMDGLEYRRNGDKNLLKLKKKSSINRFSNNIR